MEAVMTRKSVLGKNVLRNEKGLTLLELLAVIVILGIIAAIAIPSIGGIIKNTKDKAHFANAQTIIDAARLKVSNDAPTATETYTASTLASEGYLDTVPTNPDTKALYDDSTSVTVTYTAATGKYTYSVTLKESASKSYGTWTDTALKTGKNADNSKIEINR
ncbi:prepilin-type N-terminal cleavage/methylation domain-containing protein [Paenibacillus sp. SAF-054]|uniref:prepilin-type N-terminal cleavage/methylation domain-containing protein n=1 Tax=unclassified Paenibacillus TaxID=185978 RepID=UPI003F7CF4F4